jgi:multidrug transporter EmrE-like cation transporter
VSALKISFIVPLLTVVVGQVAYQLAQKSVDMSVNPLATLTFVYLIGLISCLTLGFFADNPIRLGDARLACSWQTWLLGTSIVAIELGYLQAYRNGWRIGAAFAVAATLTTITLAAIGALWFAETLSARRSIGLVLGTFGLWLVISRE